MKIFVLDDVPERHETYVKRYPGHWFKHAYNVQQAKEMLVEGPYDIAFLDHDLFDWHKVDGIEEPIERTGLDVVKFLVESLPRERWPKKVVVHTWNGSRGNVMLEILKQHGVDAYYVPFSSK